MSTFSQIQELTNNSEVENLQIKSLVKSSKFTVVLGRWSDDRISCFCSV